MKGVLLFAFNNETLDYYKMAVFTAKRVNKFLNLPVTVITDEKSITDNTYSFDKTIFVQAQTDNKKGNQTWINKGRYQAYDLSPYDETIVLDTDYIVNSQTLLKPFELYDDFMCHKNTSFIMDNKPQELIGKMLQTLWATVLYFKKTQRTKYIFECMKMIQYNYAHYVQLYNVPSLLYRNDYSLTIANKIVNGHLENQQDYIPWNLNHVDKGLYVSQVDDTIYKIFKQNKRTEYVIIKDTDFHMLDKNNFMRIVNG